MVLSIHAMILFILNDAPDRKKDIFNQAARTLEVMVCMPCMLEYKNYLIKYELENIGAIELFLVNENRMIRNKKTDPGIISESLSIME